MGDPDARFEHRALPGGLLEISFTGRLRPGWAGNLTAALARRGLSVERGHARSDGAGAWRGRLCLRPPAAAGREAAVPELDVGALASERVDTAFLGAPRVLAHEVEVLRDPAALLLRITAEDRLGLLAALLRRLAYLALFPSRLEIETEAGRVRDAFWLRGVGGDAPDEHQAAELAALMASLRSPRD